MAPSTVPRALPTLSEAQAQAVIRAINNDARSAALLNQTQTVASSQNTKFTPLEDRSGSYVAAEAEVLLSRPYTGEIVAQIPDHGTTPPTPGRSAAVNVVGLTTVRFVVDLRTDTLIGIEPRDAQDVEPA